MLVGCYLELSQELIKIGTKGLALTLLGFYYDVRMLARYNRAKNLVRLLLGVWLGSYRVLLGLLR